MGSYVVTGGGHGVGRAITERLLADGHQVVVLDRDPEVEAWVGRGSSEGLRAVIGSAADEAACQEAADAAVALGGLSGWVNNAATFRDADLATAPPAEVLALVEDNLAPSVVGSAVAVRRLLADGTGGAIVNVSSHQAQRPVRGALPYATAKAAVEGLTRALAVEYGPRGIRSNAVALGSIETERHRALLAALGPQAAGRVTSEIERLHPVGRIGQAHEVAATVAFLLSEDAGFVNGAILPVDGGRSVWGPDPEET